LHLIGSPHVTTDRRRVRVPEGSKRLLAFVALHDRCVERRYAAGVLWPNGDDFRAAANLRSALWRLKEACPVLIVADRLSLSLGEEVLVDFHVVDDWATRLVTGSESASDLVVLPCGPDSFDLFPGWYDDWAIIVREQFRHRILRALEALCTKLVRTGRFGEAVEAAMLVVNNEPLRESGQRALIEAHIAEGNWIEGRRRFEAYRRLLLSELGIEPDPFFSDLLRNHAGGSR
jgi:DNA-binding SARP family transcriptional activator